MLEVRNLSKAFGGIRALDDCSLMIPRGQITAIVGPNGAGKTTLFDVVSGFICPDRGDVLLNRVPLTALRPDEIANHGIRRTWQQVRLFRYLTVVDHLRLAENHADARLLRNLFGREDPALRAGDDRYQRLLAEFGIDCPLDTPVSTLSYGQRKLLQLAMVVSSPHAILLLDEPVAGVHPVIQERIERLLLGLKARGETVAIVEHDMAFVKKLADHVVVMDAGHVLLSGEPVTVLRDQRVLEAYLGE